MNSILLTYRDLISLMKEHAEREGKSPQSISNLLSALTAFMAYHGFSETQPISSDLRISYYRRLREHIEWLREEKRSDEYIANRKHLLGKWHSLINRIDRANASDRGEPTPFVSKLVELKDLAGSQRRLAQEVGIPLATLKRWMLGQPPSKRSSRMLIRLESFFALGRGTLTDLIENRPQHPGNEDETSNPIEFRKRLANLSRTKYRLKTITEHLRTEWVNFVTYKTSDFSGTLERHERGTWRAKQIPHLPNAKKQWFCYFDGRYVVTADITWKQISAYLGWLVMPKDCGGMGLQEDQVQSLSWLLSKDHIHAYVSWYTNRSGGAVHQGVKAFIQLVKMLTHPVFGYLTQSPQLAPPLPECVASRPWSDACSEMFEWTKKALKQSRRKSKQSRDPTEPIQHILELANPQEAVADMIERMKSDRPTTGGLAEAIWARDILMIKLFASNPLRAANMKGLTYTPDNTGELHQKKDGSWHILIAPENLKNETGAALDNPYDMPVNECVWGDLERYFKRYRPLLPKSAEMKNVFLSSENQDVPSEWETLNRRVSALTKKYLWRCPGIGPHAFRYILATTILKLVPGAWEVAAQVLHDKEETVRKHYAHLKGKDGGVRAFTALKATFSRM